MQLTLSERDALGEGYDFRSLYAGPESHRPARLRLRRATPGDAPHVKRRRYYLYSFDPDTGWSPNAAVPCVDLEQGQLFVNGVQIVAPQVTNDHVTWLQHAKDSSGTHYLAGHLHIHSNGVEAHGVIVTGENHRDAVRHDVLATAIPSVTYRTRITSARYPVGTDPSSLPESAWEDGLPGFLVAVNYPQLREEHFMRAFAGITDAERVYLRSHFEPLVPFLRRGLGNYVSEILRRALGAPGETEPIGAPAHTVEYVSNEQRRE